MKVAAELMQYAKQRRYPRAIAPNNLVVTWQGGGRRGAGRVRDLSLGGIYIWNLDPPVPGTPVQLQFGAPEGEFRVSAQVRYIKPHGGMGVEFVGMDFPSRRCLSSLLQRLLTH